MTKFEKISSALGVFGFVVSLIALGVSVWGHVRTTELHNERMQFDDEQRRSKVVVQIGRDLNQKSIEFWKYRGPFGYGAVYKQRYNLVLNNIGFQAASITDWRVVGRSPMVSEETGEYLYGWYEGMGPWYYAPDGSDITLPLTIEPNKPKKIVIEVGARIPNSAWNEVSQSLSFDQEYDYYEAESVFSERGHPQFGQYMLNRVSQHGRFTAVSYGPGPYQQDFILYLTKGNGTQVEAKFLPSISDSFVQGENSGTSWEKVMD